MTEKKTKIICTISDLNCSISFLSQLYKEGMNVVRINSAHANLDGASDIINKVRQVSDKIAILIDTKGPEIRITPMDTADGFLVEPGDRVEFRDNLQGISTHGVLYTNYKDFVSEIPVGEKILIDDGDIELSVIEKNSSSLICTADNRGVIKGRKSINIPNISLDLPSISDRDKEFIVWAIKNDIDFVAHSFVRNKKDLIELQQILNEYDSHLKIIAKIENQEGVDNLDEILSHCYGVMVARGDLGIEIEYQKIPIIQRAIIHKCQKRKKPVIIATQMLHTMIENPRPTRAEVSDVANAIYQRADAIMLSGETANGKYPVESVRTMTKIANEIEKQLHPCLDLVLENVTEKVAAVLARSLVESTTKLPIKAIVLDTISGRTGRYLSAFRPNVPIFAKCYRPQVVRELALSYGVIAHSAELTESKDGFVKNAVRELLSEDRFNYDDMIGVLAGSFGPSNGATFVEISNAKNMIS